MSFGLYATFPFSFGDTSEDPLEVEHGALLAALEAGYDSTENTVHEVECFAHALGVAMVWDAGERLSNQAQPEKMMEALPVWEEILDISPIPGTTDNARRATVGARLRGLQNNAMPDIEEVCATIMGANFDAVVTVDPADVVSYWPGGIPGPPGWEWCSNNAIIAVRLNKNGVTESEFYAKLVRLGDQLQRMLPAWITFDYGLGDDGFMTDLDIVDIDFI